MHGRRVLHRHASGRRRIVGAVLVSAIMGAVAVAQPPRVIYWEPGVSLLSKLRADDRVVAVPGGVVTPGIDVGTLTLPEYIEIVVHGTAAAIVLDVTSAAARLDDDESWVVTDISGTVKRVLYTRKGQIDANRPLVLTYVRGGEMKVGPVLLKVGVVPNVHPGRSYLVFLDPTVGGRWSPSEGLFEINSAQRVIIPARPVVPLPDDYFPELVLNNARVDLVLDLIRAELEKK